MHRSHSLSSIRSLHWSAWTIISQLHASVGVCWCLWETHLAKNWRSIKLQCPKDTKEPCEETSRSVPLHRINWRFFRRWNTHNEILSILLRQWHHHTLITPWQTRSHWSEGSFDDALRQLFELREPVNFAAHELRLMCELEFGFRRQRHLILHRDPEESVHTCS